MEEAALCGLWGSGADVCARHAHRPESKEPANRFSGRRKSVGRSLLPDSARGVDLALAVWNGEATVQRRESRGKAISRTDDRFLSSVAQGRRPAKFHEKP